MNLKSLTIAVSAVFLLLCCVARAQPQNISELIKEIQTNMDRNLDPCQDFYEFACGGFLKTHAVPANTTDQYLNWPVFEAVVNDTLRTIRRVVEQPWPIVNDFYRSCARPQHEIDRAADETLRVYADWFNTTSLATDTEIWTALALLSSFDPFFELGGEISTTDGNVTFRGPVIEPSSSYLALADYKNVTKVTEFLEFAAHAFSNDTKLIAAKKAETVIEIDRYLASFRDGDFDPIILTISNASRETNIDWEAYFDKIGVYLKPTERIQFYQEAYFRNLTKYVTGLPEQSLKNYLQFKVYQSIWELNETLSCYTGEDNCDGQLILPGYPYLSHDDRCAFLTSFVLSDLVSFIITEETDAQSTVAAERVASYLREATNSSLPSLKWIVGGKDLQAATEKIEGAITSIGKQTTERFSEVETQPDNIFENYFSISAYEQARFVRDTFRVPNRTDFAVFPSLDVVNFLESNLIYVPAALLNSEVFSANWPKLFQFAKLGGLIGRQFVHTIDTQGQYFTVTGDYGELFSFNTSLAFETASGCVASVYSNYTFPNITFNTHNNLYEDIADIGGLKNSFQAYHAYIARYGKEFPDGGVIPGFSTDQVFFLISAQLSCSIQNEEYSKEQQLTNFAPNHIRTNGAVSQSVEFAKAYNCPANAPMNPARKCNIF